MMDYFRNNESKEKEGFIILLDVLGTRGYWLRSDPKIAVNNFTEIVDTMEIWKSKLGNLLQTKNIELNLSTYCFSDTILMTLIPEKNVDKIDAIKKCSFLISSVIIKGIDLGILFRGTISFGKFYKSEEEKHSFTIGPAVDEAADWYDKISLIGAICSPSVGLSLDAYVEKNPNKLGSKYFIKHNVLLKNNSYNTWILSWPIMISYYLGHHTNSSDPPEKTIQYLKENKSWLLEKFSKIGIGSYDFGKFENTMKFYDTLVDLFNVKKNS